VLHHQKYRMHSVNQHLSRYFGPVYTEDRSSFRRTTDSDIFHEKYDDISVEEAHRLSLNPAGISHSKPKIHLHCSQTLTFIVS
jgi:hypothetical protein